MVANIFNSDLYL